MTTLKFWITDENRANCIKEKFTDLEGNLYDNMTVETDVENTFQFILTDPSSADLLALFHAGISYGFKLGTGAAKI